MGDGGAVRRDFAPMRHFKSRLVLCESLFYGLAWVFRQQPGFP